MLSFGVLIAFLLPKQSEIEGSYLESKAKISEQGIRTHHWRAAERGLQQDLLTLINVFHLDNIFGQDMLSSGWSCRIAWRRVSSWGIRMELSRIAMRAPYHQGERSLHLAHADGPPCDIAPSTQGNSDGVYSDSLAARDISHPDGRGRRFNFPGQACPDPLIEFTRRASAANISDHPDFAQCRGVLLKLLDIFHRLSQIFSLKIFCVNFYFLLVISQRYYWDISQKISSLYISLNQCKEDILYIYGIDEQGTCSVFPIFVFLFFLFLANQTLRIFPQRMIGQALRFLE